MLQLWSRALRCLSLRHDDVSVFTQSQWQLNRSPSIFYLIYRLLITGFFVVVWLLSVIDEKHLDKPAEFRVKWLIYLTNWGFTVCTVQALFGTVILLAAYISTRGGEHVVDERQVVLRALYKPYWVLFSIAMDLSVAITLLYWILIYDSNKVAVDTLNVLVHGTNSAAMVIELLVTANPIAIVHCLWTVLFGLVYIIFSAIYHAFDGTSREGLESIYPILDWNKGGITTAICVGVLVFLILLHIVIYGVYWLRTWLCARYWRRWFGIAQAHQQPGGGEANGNGVGVVGSANDRQPVTKSESMNGGYDNVGMTHIGSA